MAWTGNKKVFCVLEFAKTESNVMVQWGFRTVYRTEPPADKTGIVRVFYMLQHCDMGLMALLPV
jgi:hypothetical protein